VGVIVGVTLLVYGTRLGPPPPLTPAETALVREAQSVASTGRGTSGRQAPLFFQVSDEVWLQPMAVYATAGFLWVTSSTAEWGSRLATVRIAVISALLMYLLARRLSGREWIAVSAPVLLLLTPAMFVHARAATDAPYALPFFLGWLYCLLVFLDRPRIWVLAVAGLVLGLGVYSQPAAPITMASLAALTIVVMWNAGYRGPRQYAAFAAGFTLPLMVMAVWFASYPDTYRDTMGRWAIHQAHIRFPLDGWRAFINWTTLGTRTSLYWDFFDPAWLFFSGPDRGGLLRGAAPFLLPMAVLAPFGVTRVVAKPAAAIALIGGIVIAPMAASTFGEAHNIAQALTVVPLVVLLAGLGVEQLFEKTVAWRALGFVLLALVPLQFGVFYVSRLP